MQVYHPNTEYSTDALAHHVPLIKHVSWCGNFNWHHLAWDEDYTLFMTEAIRMADKVLTTVTDYGLEMVLPDQIPVLHHMVTKRWS